MFTTILVPLDGSLLAERAVPYAERLALATGANLALVRAETSGITGSRVIVIHQALAYLEKVAAGPRARGVTVTTSAPYGQPAGAVIAEAGRTGADLIALATHGRTGAGHLAYGSVAEEILARAQVPVLLVGAHGDVPAEPLAADAPVLVPLDGSAFAERVLPVARELAAQLGGGVVLVQSLGELESFSPGVPTQAVPVLREALCEEEVAALDYLRKIARLELSGGDTTCVARVGKPVRVIAEVCRDYSPALVVMATHRRFGLARFFFGNVANDAVRAVGVPFLLIGPPSDEEVWSEEATLTDAVLG